MARTQPPAADCRRERDEGTAARGHDGWPAQRHERVLDAVPVGMRLIRLAALVGIAKKLYDEFQKPENRARIQAAVEKVKARSRASS